MRVLITAGGTVEKIDDVRDIRNTSTGRLGQLIADAIREDIIVDYIHGTKAMIPHRATNLYEIESVRDLDETVEKLMHANKYDVVIHAMAVSDYMIQSVTTYEHLSSKLDSSDIYRNLVSYPEDLNREEKIRSTNDNLVVMMKKAPKIISKIKQYQEDTILVGFKLLVDVSEQVLIQTATDLLIKNNADYVLANDLTSIEKDKHKGFLINKDNEYDIYNTKQEIAEGIVERLKLK